MSLSLLALKTLLADRGKLAAALVGVVFSVVLVNVQGGLFLGLIGKAGLLVDHSQADIWVGHKHMHNVDFPRDIPRRWLHRVQAVPGVASAEPYVMGFAEMTLPSGNYENVVVIGVPPHSELGQPWNVTDTSASLNQTDAIYVDACDDDKLESPQVGELREIGGRRARIVGQTQGLLSFLVSPYVFASYNQALTLLKKDPRHCSYFLVKLKPQSDVQEVCRGIMQRTPELDALPAKEYSRLSQRFWLTRTGIGISFGAATGMGLLVGLVMVAQTLYASVLDRVSEFAALKAMGASDGQILSLLAAQSLFMAIVGTLLGLGSVMGLHRLMHSPRAPVEIPLWLSAASFVLVLIICLLAALLPYQRIRRVDPLSVLQGG
jgi:putative ABC transport system permease protein